jgi:serine/threonine-protein kinase
VRDAEVADDSILLVMDYIEGGSLAELPISAEAVPDRSTVAAVLLRVVLDVAAGLHAAHELADEDNVPLGLVHRDISPHNVLIGLDGVARVTDFGIAKCFSLGEDATTDGVVKGKFPYMSPEQIQSQRVDRRSDVFALGIVLWESMTGRRLFRSNSPAETITRVLTYEVPRISELAPELAALDDVVAKALERSPAARFGSASELAEALELAAAQAGLVAGHQAVARFVVEALGGALATRRERIRALRGSSLRPPPGDVPSGSEGTGSISVTTEVQSPPKHRPSLEEQEPVASSGKGPPDLSAPSAMAKSLEPSVLSASLLRTSPSSSVLAGPSHRAKLVARDARDAQEEDASAIAAVRRRRPGWLTVSAFSVVGLLVAITGVALFRAQNEPTVETASPAVRVNAVIAPPFDSSSVSPPAPASALASALPPLVAEPAQKPSLPAHSNDSGRRGPRSGGKHAASAPSAPEPAPVVTATAPTATVEKAQADGPAPNPYRDAGH